MKQSKFMIPFLLIIAILITGCTENKQKACTQEAKQCPDGSYVSREPLNNCEFKPCPKSDISTISGKEIEEIFEDSSDVTLPSLPI